MSQASQIRTYDPAESVVFLKTKERFGGLSNMAAGFPLQVNGVRIRTSEALYQACRFPHMPDVQRKIIDERSPMTAKMRSKPFRKDSRPDWDAVRVKIMRWCLRVKLAQNWREFGRLLLATGDRPIVEQSRKDDFWGAKVAEDGSLVGMNVLGRLLMELREQLRGNEAESLQSIEPLAIPEFLLFRQPIEAICAADGAFMPVGIEPHPSRPAVAPPPCHLPQPSLFDQPMIVREQMDIQQSNRPAEANSNRDPIPYPGYRDSGLPWLGEIPEHWEVRRSKYVFREVDKRSETGEETQLSMSQVHGLVESSKIDTWRLRSESYAGGKLCEAGDLVLNRLKAHLGVFAHASIPGVISPDYTVFRRVDGAEVRYFEHLYKSPIYKAELRKRTKGIVEGFWRLYSDDFYDLRVVVPPKEEQAKIVAFVDAYDRRVRRLIRSKRRIAELASERLKLATHDAMTSPGTYEARLEVATTLVSRPVRRTEADSFVPVGLFNRGRGLFKKPETLTDELGDSDFFWIEADDLIISGQFAWEGAVALADGEAHGCIASHRYPILRGKTGMVDTAYLLAFLRSDYGSLLLDLHSRGAAGRNRPLNVRSLRKEKINIPPMEEQEKVKRLVELEASVRRRLRFETDRILEYRERLIAEVVTGKLDVRHIEIAAPADEPVADEDEALEEELEGGDAEVMEGGDVEK